MLSEEIKALMGETDKLDELKAIMDKADDIENALAETQKSIAEKDAEIADKNKRLANLFLSVTEHKDTEAEKIDKNDFTGMTEEEFDEAMRNKYGEDTVRKEILEDEFI